MHNLPAHAHRSAAETHEKQDHKTGQERSKLAIAHSQKIHEYTQEAHRNAVNQHGIAIFGHDEIAALAHELWQARGCPDGSAEEDLFNAAKQLRVGTSR